MQSNRFILVALLLLPGCYSAQRGNAIRYITAPGTEASVDDARVHESTAAAAMSGKPGATSDQVMNTTAGVAGQKSVGFPETRPLTVVPLIAESRIALVIGNNAYASSPLRTPAEDARAFAEKLRHLGFDVTLREDGTRQAMIEAIEAFTASLRERQGVGLFYYAGHALQIDGQNFLVPTDADINTEMSARANTVEVDALLKTMADAKGRVSVIILDSCRNNPFRSRVRGASSGLAQVSATGNDMLIEFSTAPGMTAADGDGVHSPYAQALLETIETPGLSIEQLFKQIRVKVIKATDNQQRPWEESSLTGDFRFK